MGSHDICENYPQYIGYHGISYIPPPLMIFLELVFLET